MSNFMICKKINYSDEHVDVKNKVDSICNTIETEMKLMGYTIVNNPRKNQKIDYLFSVGGDGTMLHSMHNFISNQAKIIGINAGNLGFLTSFTINEVNNGRLFNNIKKNNFRIEKRSILKHLIGDSEGYSVNEYSITPENLNEVIEFSITTEKDGIVSNAGYYKANNVLISGPSGSTAYNMNAGGAIIDPSMRCMQILMIAPQTIGVRPIIISDGTIIKIHCPNKFKLFNDGVLAFNGNEEGLDINISLHEQEAYIMLPKKWNFYSTLSQKLHWNNGRKV